MTSAHPLRLCMVRGKDGTAPALVSARSGDRLIDLRAAAAHLGRHHAVDARLLRSGSIAELVAAGLEPDALRAILDREDELPGHVLLPNPGAFFGAFPGLACPVEPRQLFCVGMNIANLFVPEKISGQMPLIREAPYAAPFWWLKAASSVAGPHDDIVHPGPGHTNRVIPEPELGLVVGRRMGPGIASPKAAQAERFLAGYCVVNEVSALDLEFERGGDPFAYNLAWSKCYPTFAPIGPALTVAGSIDPADLAVSMRINGEERLATSTARYLWSPGELIEYFASVVILEPGDVIACGNLTGENVVNPGDVVEITIEGIGTLVNRVAATTHPTEYAVPEKVTEYARRFTATRR